MSTNDCSLVQLLRDHPELPPFRQLDSWRANNKNGFAERWREARKGQAHFLVQKCLDLQKSVNAQNAHQVRVRFDILRWVAAKLNPSVYGEKPLTAPVQIVMSALPSLQNASLKSVQNSIKLETRSLSKKRLPMAPPQLQQSERVKAR